MKRSRLISAIPVIICAACAAAYGLNSNVEVKIGGRISYCWWQPPWSDGLRYVAPSSASPVSTPYKIKKYDTAPAIMYGFMVSAQFLESWIFSSSFMYGNFFSRSITPVSYIPASLSRLSYSKDIKRYDFDARLGYQINQYISAYVCVKTLSNNHIEKINNAQASLTPSLSFASAKGEFIDVGPGLGIGINVPLYHDLSLLINTAGLVFAGSGSYVYSYQYSIISAVTQILDQYQKESFYSYSWNGSLALEYFIKSAGMTLQLGGRYDIVYYQHHRTLRGFLDYSDKYDRFYGITFATIYSFTLGDSSAMK